jgi:Ca2+-binding RTX toxin-like protein
VIQLENSVFTALPTPGALAAAAFTLGAAATTAAHRIGYNAASGALWYDADGNGAGMSITFAQLNTGVVGMTAARFVVT